MLRASSLPNELESVASPLTSETMTSPLLLLTTHRFAARATVTRPKRLLTSRSPSMSDAMTGPLELTIVASPALPASSIEPKEFSRLCLPRPARNAILPLLLTTSDPVFRPSTSTLPNRLRTPRTAASGITIS